MILGYISNSAVGRGIRKSLITLTITMEFKYIFSSLIDKRKEVK